MAAVLELAQALKDRPLRTHRVKPTFWDLEDRGLPGAHAWVAAAGQEKPALYVNFDVFGWGDTLWMMTPDGNALVAALRAQAANERLGLQTTARYPPTDHLAFLKAGWPAVSFSLLGVAEVADMQQAFAGRKPKRAPRVMDVIHTPAGRHRATGSGPRPGALRVPEAGLPALDTGPLCARTE